MQLKLKRTDMEPTYLAIVASLDRSNRCAASTADTIAPSKAERSHISSVTRNFRAKLKNAVGPLEALTAITCRGLAVISGVDGEVLADGWSLFAAGFLSCSPPLDGCSPCFVGVAG